MKNKNLSLNFSFKPLARFFNRFHTIVFFLIVGIGMAVAILTLLSIIQFSSTSASSSTHSINDSFDAETIKRINELGSEPPPVTPGVRTNPFVE